VVLNSDNQIVSAIDYDCWGYPLENRSYQSDDINYKFTGKQRDAETGYDYFGARYYDARIGRWGGVEPLLEKYISYSPYQYGLLNPMKLVDVNGKDVYIFGSDSKATVEYMNKESKSTGLTFSIDDNGKLSVTGKPQDKNANLLYYAVTDEKNKIGLFTVRSDIATFGSNDFTMNVGTYLGNFSLNGDNIAIQYFNLPQAIAYNEAGGSSVGVSAFHEIKEAQYGVICYPGSDGYTKAHKLTVKSDPKIPDPLQVYDRTNKKYFYVKNEDKENAATADRFYPKY